MQDYEYPTVTVVFCKNSTENGNWCKTKEEIREFMLEHPFFFIH